MRNADHESRHLFALDDGKGSIDHCYLPELDAGIVRVIEFS